MKNLYFILIGLTSIGLIAFISSLVALNEPLNVIVMVIIFGCATFTIGYLAGKFMRPTKYEREAHEK